MIVLFSKDGDTSTNKIIDWLFNFNIHYLRVNLENESPQKIKSFYDGRKINISLELKNGFTLKMNEVDFCVFRGGLFLEQNLQVNTNLLPKSLSSYHLRYEIKTLINLF